MAQDSQEMVRTRMLDLLFEKVEADTYPSSTMLDLIESLITSEEVEKYAEILLAKIESENYPSLSLVQRVVTLT